MQVTLEKLMDPKHRRDSDVPLTDTTIDFTFNLVATDADLFVEWYVYEENLFSKSIQTES